MPVSHPTQRWNNGLRVYGPAKQLREAFHLCGVVDGDFIEEGIQSLGGSKRVALPIEGDLEADDLERKRQKEKLGVDPFDVEGMLSLSYPKP